MLWPRVLADLIFVLHLAYFNFIVFGLAAILLGVVFRWGWVRNFWFRTIHLVAIGIVVGEALAGIRCPLTTWEKQFRVMAGQATYAGDFVGYWAHRLIFYDFKPWVLTVLHVTFGLAVLAAFVLAPPRRGGQSPGGLPSGSSS